VELEGKVAHVTGAAAGIGRAIALRLAREGAAVAVSDVDEEGGAETVALIESRAATAAFLRADVSRVDDVRAMIIRTEELFGGLDVLVNNAGGAREPYFPDAEPEHWIRQVEVNLLGVMLGTQYGIAALRRRGGGVMVNVSSRAGVGFEPHGAPEYAAAKAGVWRLTAALGSLSSEGIRVNCIVPDWVETEATRVDPDAPAPLVPAEEIADVAVLLIGNDEFAGRVVLCPHDGPWGVVPLGETLRVEPLPGLPRRTG
jgi:NAD(P)-dependent dehydrogenase (short-subunit alcohol dehydrogenase family)